MVRGRQGEEFISVIEVMEGNQLYEFKEINQIELSKEFSKFQNLRLDLHFIHSNHLQEAEASNIVSTPTEEISLGLTFYQIYSSSKKGNHIRYQK